MPTDLLNITWESGKYGLIQDHTGKVVATRYGKPCPGRDLVGDKYTLSLAQALEASRARIVELEAELAAALPWNFT